MIERDETENELMLTQNELLSSQPEVVAWLERLPLRMPVSQFELSDGSD